MLKTLKFTFDANNLSATQRMENDLRQGLVLGPEGNALGKFTDHGLDVVEGKWVSVQEIDTDVQFIHSDMT